MAGQVKVMVPLNVKNRFLVTFAKAKTLYPRVENIPDIDKPVVACTGYEVTAWTELDAI